MPTLVLSSGRLQPDGPGRIGTRLATRSAVRLPTTTAHSPNASPGPSGGTPAPPGGSILAGEDLVSAAAQALLQLADASPVPGGPVVPNEGPGVTPRALSPPALGLAPARPGITFSGFDGGVGHTICNARAPSTRLLYANRWKLFDKWCRDRGLDPIRCPVPAILLFLQDLLDKGRSPSTLKVYLAAISCWHIDVDGATVGRNKMVSLFLRGARRLHPPRRHVVPLWDLDVVLTALRSAPFEPLSEVGLKWLSMKTAFLLAMVSAKRVSELQAFSIKDSCFRWNPDGSGVTLWPDPSFVPKVPSMSPVGPLQLARFDSDSQHLCPVRSLAEYVRETAEMRKSDQLFVCFAGPRVGHALSKQRLSQWVVCVITEAYARCGRPLPAGVRCHSTRGVSTSWAAMTGVPLETICAAASWTSSNTFTRFYRVNVATPHPLDGVLRQRRS